MRTYRVGTGWYGPNVMSGERAHLRLVWSAPERPTPPRIDLARAIEQHLSGEDGLTDEQFLCLYATGLPRRQDLQRVSPLRPVACPREVG